MRIKMVALVPETLSVPLRQSLSYRETLLLNESGLYGLPELMGIRIFGKHDERSNLIHYGHDPRDQEEKLLEVGRKDEFIYRYTSLGFKPVGEFSVSDGRFRWKEFEGRRIHIKETRSTFLILHKTFHGDDPDMFEEKQKRAWSFFQALGVKPSQLLSMDYWWYTLSTLQS